MGLCDDVVVVVVVVGGSCVAQNRKDFNSTWNDVWQHGERCRELLAAFESACM